MPNYKLGIGSKNKERIIEFTNNPSLNSLKNLDLLTQECKNVQELKMYLYNKGLINNDELNKNICIIYKYKGFKRLPIIYKDVKPFLDLDYLSMKLKSLSKDTEFLEKLARHYSLGSDAYNPQGLNVSDIRGYLSEVRANEGHAFYSKSLEIALQDLYEKAVFRVVDYKTGEIKENYRGLRDLALFIYKFELNVQKNNESLKKNSINNKEYSQLSLFESSDIESIYCQDKQKIINNKKY